MKTAICGYSGSGKSTLARRIGEIEQVPVLYLDTIQFVANWQERNRVEARSIVRAFMKQENWVIDGNYTNFFYQERMEAADRILILAFNRFTCCLLYTSQEILSYFYQEVELGNVQDVVNP